MMNETALITGGTRGIGRQLAELFLQEGCKVAICARNAKEINETVGSFQSKYPNNIIGMSCDVGDPVAVHDMVKNIVQKLGSLRILVANAGIAGKYGPFIYFPPNTVKNEAEAIFNTNIFGVMNIIAAVIPYMQRQNYGRIITLSGGGADRPISNMSLYSASKGAVVAFSKCLAVELAEYTPEIHLNIFHPGMLKTHLTMDFDVVSGWRNLEDVRSESALVLQYLGGDLNSSCQAVIPYVLPSCKANGKLFRGFSLIKLIRGGLKLQKVMKNVPQPSTK